MLLVGKNNAHHLKAQNSKTLEKEGRKECKYPNAPFGVSSITNQPTNQPTNFSFFVSISGLSILLYLMYTICLACHFLHSFSHQIHLTSFKETKGLLFNQEYPSYLMDTIIAKHFSCILFHIKFIFNCAGKKHLYIFPISINAERLVPWARIWNIIVHRISLALA
jgi:hypothetical protein